MKPIEGLNMAREGNRTTVTCPENGEEATYQCNGTSWNGHMPNCSTTPENEVAETGDVEYEGK